MADYYTKEERAAYTRAWRDRRRQATLERFGNCCQRCGSTEQLEFDHVDRTSKYREIGKLWTASKMIFEEELEKVQLLCRPCHQDKGREHGDIGNPKLKNGGVTRVAMGADCKSAVV